MKSSEPWVKIIGGIIAILAGGLTLFLKLPLIWIGGFIWGVMLIINGIKQLSEKTIYFDNGSIERNKYNGMKDTESRIVITCGACSHKFYIRKGKGRIKIKCPKCKHEYNIKT